MRRYVCIVCIRVCVGVHAVRQQFNISLQWRIVYFINSILERMPLFWCFHVWHFRFGSVSFVLIFHSAIWIISCDSQNQYDRLQHFHLYDVFREIVLGSFELDSNWFPYLNLFRNWMKAKERTNASIVFTFNCDVTYEEHFHGIVLEFLRKSKVESFSLHTQVMITMTFMSRIFINSACVCHLALNKVKSSNAWKYGVSTSLIMICYLFFVVFLLSIEWLLITWISRSQAKHAKCFSLNACMIEVLTPKCVWTKKRDYTSIKGTTATNFDPKPQIHNFN